MGDRRRVPLDAGGDLVDGFVRVPVLRWSSRFVATLLLFGFDDLCVEFEGGIVVIADPRFPHFVSVGFTGERAVGQPADRVLKVFLGAIKVVVDTTCSASIKSRGVYDDTSEIMPRDWFLIGLDLVGSGVFV